MDSRERDGGAKKGRNEREEKIHNYKKHRSEIKHSRSEKNKLNKRNYYTEKFNPDDSEFEPDPDEENELKWEENEEEDDDDDNDDYMNEEDDENY